VGPYSPGILTDQFLYVSGQGARGDDEPVAIAGELPCIAPPGRVGCNR